MSLLLKDVELVTGKMKVLLLLGIAGLCGICWCRPQDQYQGAYITRYENEDDGNGGYHYALETSDGFKRYEIAQLKYAGTENEVLAVEGSYSYIGPDNQEYTVLYTADENGYQPSGNHLPPSAGAKPRLGIPSAALASLAGGGLG